MQLWDTVRLGTLLSIVAFLAYFYGGLSGAFAVLKDPPRDPIEVKATRWTKAWRYDPPLNADGEMPLLLKLAFGIPKSPVKKGRPRETISRTAEKNDMTVDQFGSLLDGASQAKSEKRFAEYCLENHLSESTVNDWLAKYHQRG
jgi:hypothetical protein